MYKYSVDSQNRALAVVVQLVSGVNLLTINVYLPCSTNSNEYMTSMLEIYGFIENCIECCSYDEVIVLGDFNFECDVSVPAYKLLVKVTYMSVISISCENYANTPIEFTYFQDTLHRYTLIDHMFASTHLATKIIKYSIIESGVNFSDHVPICCVLALPKCCYSTKETESLKNSTLRWDKGDCNLYYHVTGELFQNLQVPYELLEMTNGVDCGIKQQMINVYYNDIINILNTAAMKSFPF